jgi:hypothetical protein
MLRIISSLCIVLLLFGCNKEQIVASTETNDVSLKITAPHQDEQFERGLSISVDGILQSEKCISGYEVIFIHAESKDTLDYYYEEGNFNYFTVHHHYVNKFTSPTRVNIVINAVDKGETLVSAQLSVRCKG